MRRYSKDREEFKHILRKGQILMHTLYKYDKEKYRELTDTEYDCFFIDSRFDKTIEKLIKDWDD